MQNYFLFLVKDEIEKSVKPLSKYQKTIPEKIKREVGIYADSFGTASAIKKFTSKYSKYSFSQTIVNSWKNKFIDGASNLMFKQARRLNFLDSNLIKKVLRYCHPNENS